MDGDALKQMLLQALQGKRDTPPMSSGAPVEVPFERNGVSVKLPSQRSNSDPCFGVPRTSSDDGCFLGQNAKAAMSTVAGLAAQAPPPIARLPLQVLAPVSSAPTAAAESTAPATPDAYPFHVQLHELELKHRLGHGSSGSTYLANFKGGKVAVKVANSDLASMESWRHEVSVLAQLRHPNLIRCLAAVEAPPSFCLVLEYCDGGDVGAALQKPTPPRFFFRIAKGVASACDYLHQVGYMHSRWCQAFPPALRTAPPIIRPPGTAHRLEAAPAHPKA